ncbi:MAG: BrnA antitoxin family protein [bacterium]
MKRKRRLTDEEFLMKPFDFKNSRRVTPEEVEAGRRAIEALTGKPRPPRGRPPIPPAERHRAVSIRLHPKALAWARREAARRGLGYQTVINETLLRSAEGTQR